MPVSEVPSRHLTMKVSRKWSSLSVKLLYFLLLMYVRLAC
jgi:hypothetical protein